MSRTLKTEIKQTQPFASLEEEALLNMERTLDYLRRQVQQTLRPQGLTTTQYNALRILRGAGGEGMTCSELGNRLVTSDPDITRLLDRLARQKLVRRRRDLRDRRVVLTEISDEGLLQLEMITPALDARVRQILQHLGRERLELLIDLLEEARNAGWSQRHQEASETMAASAP
ncbi:MAG: MarR family transcriptional regulator [Acidobacteriaceae bacterium]